ncbi:flagella biosynthesis regulatory protein FliT [Lelliottia nimipressuralis]|jgi:flagellar protein FliT|uniref:Flagellar protein FliT n=1 Tax=Lelliottia nimipressuralis TaxID=69220 RepID=A0ABD4K836_9ENTR|nr:flagella biosynthesis regulatory protein FliT [Lelliottia nimipressuralis]MDH6632153.1 flagellar protein FliT [Lelliottia amnigena]PKA31477.1 flagella biosynthesis regulatory protein FliT [Cedecea lapagei]MBF4178088.1 flagella biosynthesis regulatory protein FliT [Lelliottia nimipressuralis]RXJ13041.1 flagella biosynthesis regulatory protein FliT [Lelliottia nimipressuralis]TYT28611.1 flagella biosynthesis regulatory protein FliT [Lelliottia nimipressuralis]
MNDSSLSLKKWHALFALSNTMLSLAQSGKWDELIEQEVAYVTLVEQISVTPFPPDSKHIQDQAMAILKNVLQNEVTLKVLLQERMEELSGLLAQTGKQKNVNITYGKLSGNVLFPGEINQ